MAFLNNTASPYLFFENIRGHHISQESMLTSGSMERTPTIAEKCRAQKVCGCHEYGTDLGGMSLQENMQAD